MANQALNNSSPSALVIFSVIFGLLGLFSLVISFAAPGGNANKNGGNNSSTNPKNSSYSISITDTTWNGYTAASVIGDVNSVKDPNVFVQCYKPTFDGLYVYAAYFPVINGIAANIGPMMADGRVYNGGATLWGSPEAADCKASLGYITRDGFGKWVELTSTTFRVSAQ